MSDDQRPRPLKVPEAARRLGLSERVVRALIRAGRLGAINVAAPGQRPYWIIPVEAIDTFLSSGVR